MGDLLGFVLIFFNGIGSNSKKKIAILYFQRDDQTSKIHYKTKSWKEGGQPLFSASIYATGGRARNEWITEKRETTARTGLNFPPHPPPHPLTRTHSQLSPLPCKVARKKLKTSGPRSADPSTGGGVAKEGEPSGGSGPLIVPHP